MVHLGASCGSRLVWFQEDGYGYYPCREPAYDDAYFDRYAALSDMPLGRRLTEERCALVARCCETTEVDLLDVGIGSGAFVDAVDGYCGFEAFGFDIGHKAVEWLEARCAFRNLYGGSWLPVVTFWDSIEHIENPVRALSRCSDMVFVTVPIFRDADHVLRSKHYRRDEHFHYWTRRGFIRFADSQGFNVIDISLTEQAMGREDVETFVLRRRV